MWEEILFVGFLILSTLILIRLVVTDSVEENIEDEWRGDDL